MVLSVYECKNKQQLIKYNHASLGSHNKRTLIEATNTGYHKGFPGLIAAGHMKQKQQDTQSTTNRSRRGRSSQHTQQPDTAAAIAEAISLPIQVQDNNRTHLVFMSVNRVEGYVASDQTGKFPRMSNKVMQYICVFYIHDPNYIKGVAF